MTLITTKKLFFKIQSLSIGVKGKREFQFVCFRKLIFLENISLMIRMPTKKYNFEIRPLMIEWRSRLQFYLTLNLNDWS